jgi:hypothetical protein
MKITREEIFGPVLAVVPVKDDDENEDEEDWNPIVSGQTLTMERGL